MRTEPLPNLSDRQARAVILAAEALGFEREPELAPAWYDHDLHDDARAAARHLQRHDPSKLAMALNAPEPISAQCAAWRITNAATGFSLADAPALIDAATDAGHPPPRPDLPLSPWMLQTDQARAAVAYFWEHDPDRLTELIGEAARLAPLPETAMWSEYGCAGAPEQCMCGRTL